MDVFAHAAHYTTHRQTAATTTGQRYSKSAPPLYSTYLYATDGALLVALEASRNNNAIALSLHLWYHISI